MLKGQHKLPSGIHYSKRVLGKKTFKKKLTNEISFHQRTIK